jgi:protein phosphatase
MAKHYCSAGRTDIGKARRRNEDAILVRDEAGLWAVADGLGGHAGGDYASTLVVERLAAVPRTGGAADFVDAIEDTLVAVSADLRRAAQSQAVDLIGSTVVVLVHDRHFMACGWVGDSRCYCCEDGRLVQITRDHLYGVDVDTRWSGGPAQSQPGGGVLTRAVGADRTLFVDWVVAGNRPDTRFVLCSDGINKEVSDAEIEAACMRHASPDGVLGELFEISLARAARDNLSAVVVFPQDGITAATAAMDDRLRETNEALRALDEAHRLGRLAGDDRRAQRRRLFEALAGDSGNGIRDADGGAPPREGTRPPGWRRWLPRRR